MILLLIPYMIIELYLSLKVGEMIGFWWSLLWIIMAMALGIFLLKRSPMALAQNFGHFALQKGDIKAFENASMTYFAAAILLIIPGVFNDILAFVALLYGLYLHLSATMKPDRREDNHKNHEEEIIDVEVIDNNNSGGNGTA